MTPKLSKDSLQVVLSYHLAQAIKGSTPAAASKPAGDSLGTPSDSSPLIIT